MIPVPRHAATAVAALAALLLACGEPPSVERTLTIEAFPRSIDKAGQKAELVLVAKDNHGDPGVGEVDLTVSPVAGSLNGGGRTAVVTLENGEAIATFACDASTDPACAGQLRILADWKGLRAGTSVTLDGAVVDPGGTGGLPPHTGGGATPSCGGDNVLAFNGSDTGTIHKGPLTVTSGTFTMLKPTTSEKTGSTKWVKLRVTPTDPKQGTVWEFDFTSPEVDQAIVVGKTYDGASKFPAPGDPGMYVYGNGNGCTMTLGWFKVSEMVWTGGVLTRATVSFEQFCERNEMNWLRGCVRVTRPAP